MQNFTYKKNLNAPQGVLTFKSNNNLFIAKYTDIISSTFYTHKHDDLIQYGYHEWLANTYILLSYCI